MARPARLELATLCLEGRRSIQLSYGRVVCNWFNVLRLLHFSQGQPRRLILSVPILRIQCSRQAWRNANMKTALNEFSPQSGKWTNEPTSPSFSGPCDEHRCAFEITQYDLVLGFLFRRNVLARLDDYFRRRLRLTYSWRASFKGCRYNRHA
jgi:hypothetical protein